jgi:P2 family phage major capsid protein
MSQKYNLSPRGRAALTGLYSAIAHRNNITNVHEQFAVDPTSEQRLEDAQRESVAFLGFVNFVPQRDLVGGIIGIGAVDMIGATNDTTARNPQYVGQLTGREFRLYSTTFDTKMPWQIIDAWSRFPDFATRYSRHVARSLGLTRLSIGWNGLSRVADSVKAENPNGEDVNIGWLQRLRLDRPDHVMGRVTVTTNGVVTATGAAAPIYIGPNADHAQGDYKNIDALAYELIAGMPSWARDSTDLVVIVSQDLVDEKYFPMINRALSNTMDGGRSISDEIVTQTIMSAKQIGGRPAICSPKFPAGTMVITTLARPGTTDMGNLSIYQQEEAMRRYILDKPELMASLVDYNSSNEGYVIEHTDFMVMAENITFGDRP